MAKVPLPTDQLSFLASIGNTCLQWALLEHSILCIIGMIDELPAEQAYTRYAGLDMIPRLNMVIALADEAKWPLRLTKRLRAIRAELQGRNGLAEKRNMFVHGAHDLGELDGEYRLTMARWKGDRMRTTVTILESQDLGNRLALLAQEAHSIFSDYGVWKFGPRAKQDTSQQIAQAKAALRFIRAKQIKRGLKLIFGNLKPI
jgi:hypothetical protein